MKLAFYYESPDRIKRNDGPPLYWKYNAVKLFGKENVLHLIPNGDFKKASDVDYHFWIDWGEDALARYLDYTPVLPSSPKIYVCSDAHLGFDYRLNLAKKFDLVFCNQLEHTQEFIKKGISKDKCLWLPHAAEPDAYPYSEMIKKYDVCFIGNMAGQNRIDFLDTMFKAFPNFFYGKRLFEQAADIFKSSKIVLNLSVKDDVNMRVFETLSCGGFLLTNELPGLKFLFEDGKHLVTFKTTEEAIEKAKYYIEHSEERNKIAKQGHEEFMKKHTYSNRLKTALEIAKSLKI